jgi:solute carrier family 10 (sodium/bile acid cotransporter), member 7
MRGVQVRAWVSGHKPLLRNLATLCLVTVPYTQIGVASSSGRLAALSWLGVAQLAAAITSALLLIRAFNAVSVELFRFGQRQAHAKTIKRAVILAASQKTLPISVTVIMQLAQTTGVDAGLATLPCVFAHFSQVVIDSVLVSWWKRHDARKAAA